MSQSGLPTGTGLHVSVPPSTKGARRQAQIGSYGPLPGRGESGLQRRRLRPHERVPVPLSFSSPHREPFRLPDHPLRPGWCDVSAPSGCHRAPGYRPEARLSFAALTPPEDATITTAMSIERGVRRRALFGQDLPPTKVPRQPEAKGTVWPLFGKVTPNYAQSREINHAPAPTDRNGPGSQAVRATRPLPMGRARRCVSGSSTPGPWSTTARPRSPSMVRSPRRPRLGRAIDVQVAFIDPVTSVAQGRKPLYWRRRPWPGSLPDRVTGHLAADEAGRSASHAHVREPTVTRRRRHV